MNLKLRLNRLSDKEMERVKNWIANKFHTMFSYDQWKKKSNLFATILGITFLMALTALVAVVFAYVDIHVWSRQGQVILVSQDKLVDINGHLYIPIKLLTS
jgi:uncharacterized membrane protein